MDESVVRSLVSMALETLKEQANGDAVAVIRNSKFHAEYSDHDNWNGGIDYYTLVFELKRRDFLSIEPNREKIASEILEKIKLFSRDDHDIISSCDIKAELEEYFDWMNAIPHTKDSTIKLICEEWELLEAIATGKSYKDEGVEQEYKERHQLICSIAEKTGFEYPITCNSLAEWWVEIRDIGSYADRRAAISKTFSPLIERLRKSEESERVEFADIADGSVAVQKAIEDANLMIGAGNYESAVDRVHTAFHGHLFDLIRRHEIDCTDDDKLPALYSKLHSYYASTLQPPEMADKIRQIIRAGASMVNAVNEIRNNNTVAHPNGQLIQKREAELVIHIVNAVVNYIDSVEQEMIGGNI